MPSRVSAVVTQAAVNAMAPGDILNDTKIKGFMARRQKDAVSYAIKMRVNGRQRWFTIGRHGNPWTPDTARKRALQILADPSIAEKEAEPKLVRFADVAAAFFAVHGPKLKPRTLEEYQRLHRLYLMPAFGSSNIGDITRAQVRAAHAEWKSRPRAANHALSVLSRIVSWAEDDEQGYLNGGMNPCARIERYHENKRERFLTGEELSRLGAALEKAETEHLVGPYAIAAIRLLILTGARLSEILTLEWSFVDLERSMVFLPDSKTGQKPLMLNDAALDVLKSIPRFANNPYVIAGQRRGGRLINLQLPWRTVRKLAGLDSVRLHDLRHTFASVAVASGSSLPVLGRQLGHSQPQTTQRYAHLADDPVRQMTEKAGHVLRKALLAEARKRS